MRALSLIAIVFGFISVAAGAQPARPVPEIERIVIISVDGLRPDVLLRAQAPHMRGLVERGSFSFWARTTPHGITLPSHVSMLTGVIPNAHGILWNADIPLAQPVYPNVPTLFELARQSGYTTAMVVGKRKMATVNKPDTIDWHFIPEEPVVFDAVVAEHMLRIVREHRPHVMFVHLATVDTSGHAHGWGTRPQLDAIEEADAHIGSLLETLAELELDNSTTIIISADHGGAGRTHGADDNRSRYIPWIIAGPGIRAGYDLTLHPDLQVETYDTFVTACTLLGIPAPRRTNGKFVSQILQDHELLRTASPAR